MKDEIKEILDFKEDADYKRLSVDEILILKDCITNLQKENEYKTKIGIADHKYASKKEDEVITLQEENKKISIQHLATVNKLIETQEENERLKEELQQEKKDFKEANDYCFELKDYKSRNEKAIKYIKEEFADLDFMKKEYKDLDKIYDAIIEINIGQVNKLLNILIGDDNE